MPAAKWRLSCQDVDREIQGEDDRECQRVSSRCRLSGADENDLQLSLVMPPRKAFGYSRGFNHTVCGEVDPGVRKVQGGDREIAYFQRWFGRPAGP
jgi:hypothetical protein